MVRIHPPCAGHETGELLSGCVNEDVRNIFRFSSFILNCMNEESGVCNNCGVFFFEASQSVLLVRKLRGKYLLSLMLSFPYSACLCFTVAD